ncbi:MAG: leucine-rich repeat domain-containing protein, partial [Paludibacteraceae bacterium]|nr:leucine-rich repeat domain-containing protein [Paludibacteraceae bacterium]
GSGAFKGNPLTTVVWKPVTCTIGTSEDAPFYSTDSKVTSFTFGDKVEVIPSYLCYKMAKLDTIALTAKVTKIGSYAFNGCSALKGIKLHEGITSVGQYALAFCTSLKLLEFPKGITTIATSVLEGCTALEEVIIPSTVTTINQDAFYNCKNLQAIHNYAITPQTITERAVYNVDKQTCILYVPMDYIDLYRAKAVWCDFKNIIGVATDLQFEDQIVQLTYLKKDESVLYMETQTWQVPHAPHIEGFAFEKWEVLAGDLNDGIQLQAVYSSDQPTGAPAVYTNPANPAQKLIRRGNVYVLQDGKTYNVNGARVE